MTRIKYEKDGMTHNLCIDGHAGYGEVGSDIVCAGVSALSFALAQTLINFETHKNIQSHVTLEEGSAKMTATALTAHSDSVLDIIFEVALNGYRMMAAQYDNNVSIVENVA